MRARAKADADALRARAEVDAAGMRAKAQAEAAAARAQAETEKIRSTAEADKTKAEQAKVQAEAKLAEMTARSAPTAAGTRAAAAPSADAASRYDGEWLVTREFEAFEEAPAATDGMHITVRGGEFIIEVGVRGKPRHSRMSGRPAEDGTLVLTGSGISGLKAHAGKPYNIRFVGQFSGDRCVLKGKYGGRAGTITLTRGG